MTNDEMDTVAPETTDTAFKFKSAPEVPHTPSISSVPFTEMIFPTPLTVAPLSILNQFAVPEATAVVLDMEPKVSIAPPFTVVKGTTVFDPEAGRVKTAKIVCVLPLHVGGEVVLSWVAAVMPQFVG